MDLTQLIAVFEAESRALDTALRTTPHLRPLFQRTFDGVNLDTLRINYLKLLKLKADYVQFTVPALSAAGRVLGCSADEDDRIWGQRLGDYAAGEEDKDSGKNANGHHIWARADMRALGAPEEFINAPTHPLAVEYCRYFVERADSHPYAILGAKGVLEHLSVRVSDDLVVGVVESGIPNAKHATTFFAHHGVLDLDHVREGDANLVTLDAAARSEVLQGAFFTAGLYRALLAAVFGRS